MKQKVEEAAHLFAESRSSGSDFPAYYRGFIAGAEWLAENIHEDDAMNIEYEIDKLNDVENDEKSVQDRNQG